MKKQVMLYMSMQPYSLRRKDNTLFCSAYSSSSRVYTIVWRHRNCSKFYIWRSSVFLGDSPTEETEVSTRDTTEVFDLFSAFAYVTAAPVQKVPFLAF